MGTTADKLQAVLNSKRAIKEALIAKGAAITDQTKFSQYAAVISQMSTGSSDIGDAYVVVEEDGVLKAQKLSFNGTEATPDGSTEAIDNVGLFATGMDEPAYNGNGTSGSTKFYKCASVDTANKTWTGYEILLQDGVYVLSDAETTGLTYGAGFTPVVGNVYTSDATIRSYCWMGNIPSGYIWGYEKGSFLPDNTITATNNNVTADATGSFMFGMDRYFDFDSQVMTGASARTFVFHAQILTSYMGGIQFVDGGSRSDSEMFGLGWGYSGNSLFYHFWGNDNSNWIALNPGDYILTFVYDGSVLKVYNGESLLGSHTTTLATGTENRYRIGNYVIDDWYSSGEWQSKFCAVYDRALSNSEIAQVVNYVRNI